MKKFTEKFLNKEGSQRGFLQIIVIVIIITIILAFLGYNAKDVWLQYVLPIFQWVWNIFITIISFVIDIVMKVVNMFK